MVQIGIRFGRTIRTGSMDAIGTCLVKCGVEGTVLAFTLGSCKPQCDRGPKNEKEGRVYSRRTTRLLLRLACHRYCAPFWSARCTVTEVLRVMNRFVSPPRNYSARCHRRCSRPNRGRRTGSRCRGCVRSSRDPWGYPDPVHTIDQSDNLS